MRILIIDDDPQILEALAVGFELQWRDVVVLSRSSATAGLTCFYEDNPDLVLLDIGLPDGNGFEVLQEIRRISDVPVIILTARGEEMSEVRGLELGADDYIVKPFGHLALIARIKSVLRRAEYQAPVKTSADFVAGDLSIDFERQQVTVKGESVKLTPVEYRLLYHLVRNAGRFLSQETLARRIMGIDYDASIDHMKVFVSRLRSKIETQDGPRYIETARGLGYRFVNKSTPVSND
jgi:DNA-binding response OmpR family regulator